MRHVRIDDVIIVENYPGFFFRLIKQESYDALSKKMPLQQQAIQASSLFHVLILGRGTGANTPA